MQFGQTYKEQTDQGFAAKTKILKKKKKRKAKTKLKTLNICTLMAPFPSY